MPSAEAPSLVFVYAVDGGLWNALVDTMHKLVSPSTYRCRLCALTYGPLGRRGEWTEALARLGLATTFLHRDELAAAHPGVDVALPAVLVARGGELEPLILAAEIQACRDLDALVALVGARVRDVR